MQFYQRIREAREDSDLTQEEIAQIIGVKQTYYSKQERGEKPFKVEQVIAICKHLDISADYILGLPKGLKWLR